MKILHTSDWHLGQRFINQDRGAEHDYVLAWLLDTICAQQIETVLVAGDVFDTSTPSNAALRRYYEFLTRVVYDCPHCRQIIIVGGNHDSPATLDAPQALLENLHVRVIGCAQYDSAGHLDLAREIVELRDAAGAVCGVVAAVPFLRDRDLKYAMAGETSAQREAALREGLREHYLTLRDALLDYHLANVPLIATGHLYAVGSSLSDSEQDIHVGNLGRIAASHFPPEFSYVALGHLHKTQRVGGVDHIRYSGSLLPLSFAENTTPKIVLVVDVDSPNAVRVTPVEVPIARRLLRFQGSPEAVVAQIQACDFEHEPLTPWAEVILDSGSLSGQIGATLYAAAEKHKLQLLKITKISVAPSVTDSLPTDLGELQPIEVFRRLCQEKNLSPTQAECLEANFTQLQALLYEENVS